MKKYIRYCVKNNHGNFLKDLSFGKEIDFINLNDECEILMDIDQCNLAIELLDRMNVKYCTAQKVEVQVDKYYGMVSIKEMN